MPYEPFDIEPWRQYLAAFDQYLLEGSMIARARMRRILAEQIEAKPALYEGLCQSPGRGRSAA